MKERKLLKSLASIGLILVLVVLTLAAACAKTTPAPAPAPAPTPAPSPAPAPPPAPSLPREISIATFPVGSMMNAVATGWAKVISQHTPMTSIVKNFAGPGVYDPMVNNGEANLGVNVSQTLARSWRLWGEFEGKQRMSNLRLLFVTAWNETAPFLVRANSDIYEAKDMKGKRVASEYGGNVNLANHVTIGLLSAGLTWDDVVKVPVSGMAAAWPAIREGRVDAIEGLGVTQPAIMELDAAIGVRFVGDAVNPEEIPEFYKLLPGSKGIRMKPKGALKKEIWGIGYPFWYYSSTHVSEEAVYQIVKTVWENSTEIQAVHPIVKRFSPETMLSAELVLPVHEGAIRFYKEKGVWTGDLEKQQKELLKLAGL